MFQDILAQLDTLDLKRSLRTIESSAGPVITLEGRPVLQFASNNYLGLATHPDIIRAATTALTEHGMGAGASRLITGTHTHHTSLERTIADFKRTESSLMFGSGYLANLGLLTSLVGPNDLILADRLCHASLLDGCRLSKARLRVFRHNDTAHLRTLLETRHANATTVILTEGVFSMDGDLASLPGLSALAQQFDALLVCDDAHGTGVMGPTGGGTAEHFGLAGDPLIHMGTLSKAVGCYGGFVAGHQTLIDYLVNCARTFIYTTALPPSAAAAAEAAFDVIRSDSDRRTRLWRNRTQLAQGITRLGFRMPNTHTPILPIMLESPTSAVHMSARLLEQGFYIPAIRPPTVPKGTSRLRITVTSEHEPEQIDALLSALHDARRRFAP